MWLVHWTTEEGLEKILEDGEIKASSETDNLHFVHEPSDDIFMSVLFEDRIHKYACGPYIFFPLDIMEYYDVSHWSSSWLFGKIAEGGKEVSIQYDDRISPLKNAKIWRKEFYRIHPQKRYKEFRMGLSGQWNEVVFNNPKGRTSIPMGEASFIFYMDYKDVDFDIPDRVSDVKELNKLLKTHI